MTTKNPKNILQEYCQKNSHELPRYLTSSLSLTPHVFQSTVQLWNGKEYRGEKGSTKKQSEIFAALEALASINSSHKELTKVNIRNKTQKETYILVDFENLNCTNLPQKYRADSTINIIYFLSSLHPFSSRLDFFKNGLVKIVPSCIKDAADIAIVYHCTRLILTKKNIRIIVLTRDHFAGALCDIIKSDNTLINIPEIYHHTSVKMMIDFLDGSVDN